MEISFGFILGIAACGAVVWVFWRTGLLWKMIFGAGRTGCDWRLESNQPGASQRYRCRNCGDVQFSANPLGPQSCGRDRDL